ncbi:hypothetical protein MLD52_09060 [Puniceicoccaceae bacterium K14]|nr:hypothetical protein [Puniceicoccaceae bacterium K14]
MENGTEYQAPSVSEMMSVGMQEDDNAVLHGQCNQPGCENTVETTVGLHRVFGFPTCQNCIDNFVPAGRRKVAVEEVIEKRWRTIAGEDFVGTRIEHKEFPKHVWQEDVSGWRPDGSGQGLLFIGDSGKCKTRTAMLLMRELMLARIECHVVWRRDLRYVKQMIGQQRDFELLNTLAQKEVLFLDDFLKQGAADERILTFLDDLLDARKSARRPVVATTQLSAKDMIDSVNMYGTAQEADRLRAESFVRKLGDMCEPVRFGRDTMEMGI